MEDALILMSEWQHCHYNGDYYVPDAGVTTEDEDNHVYVTDSRSSYLKVYSDGIYEEPEPQDFPKGIVDTDGLEVLRDWVNQGGGGSIPTIPISDEEIEEEIGDI